MAHRAGSTRQAGLALVAVGAIICLGLPTAHASPSADDRRMAEIWGIEASGFAKKGKFELAETYFRRAMGLDPHRADYVYGLALTQYRRRLFKDAEQGFVRFLAMAPRHAKAAAARALLEKIVAAESVRARKRAALLKARNLAARRKAVVAVAAAQTKRSADGTKARSPQISARRRLIGWAVIGTGSALVVGGLVGWLNARAAFEDLQASLTDMDGNGRVDGLTRSRAYEQRDAASVTQTVGGALMGIGGAAAAAGIWILATGDTSEQAVSPIVQLSGRRIAASWRF